MPFLSYAQNMEDVMLHRALREVKQGFYVDVGANSPDLQSVTKAFYQAGWRGINIEPMVVFHKQLMTARPHDINLNIAVGDRNETLDDIFRTHTVDQIHFLKIDMEGWEAHVLRGLSLETIRPWIILIKAAVTQTEIRNHEEWAPLLTGRGYRFVYFDGLNRFYVAEEKAELAMRFESPPNIFDDWVRAHDWAAHELAGNLSRRSDGELADWAAEKEAWAVEWNRIKCERATLQCRIAELEATTTSLEKYVSDLHLSAFLRITAPMRCLKRVVTDPTNIHPWRFSRPHLVKLARRVARWAAERPVLKRVVMPILLRNPILGNKARALLTRERPILAPAPARGLPLPALASPDLRCGADPLVSRSLSPAECTIEAAVQRALARAR
jgi:hypothetical protein